MTYNGYWRPDDTEFNTFGGYSTHIVANKDFVLTIKREAAMALGADAVLISDDKDAMKKEEVTFNFLLCTIPESFDVEHYICLLGPRGTWVTVGLLAPYKSATNNMELVKYSRSVAGSLIGGIANTQKVLDFCAKHNILPAVEMIDIADINDAFDKINSEDVSLDM